VDINVLKFGGSSFLGNDDYVKVARYLGKRARETSSRLVVVVSGMSGTTGNLQKAGLALNPNIPPRTLDLLLAPAEMVSVGLLETALSREMAVTSLNGFQLGIVTDDTFTRARIVDFSPLPLRRALRDHQVVVVAGGQAVTRDGRLTMLGRNSSDLTAVAVAQALEARHCEIFSDVCGVYTSDPYLVANTALLPEIPHQTCAEMSRSGAKVLYFGAVEQAASRGTRIVCKSLLEGDRELVGTVVGAGRPAAVVVPSTQLQLVQLPGQEERRRARRLLDERHIPSIEVDAPSGPLLATWAGAGAPGDILQAAGLSAVDRPELGLVTEIAASGTVSRHPVARDQVAALAQSLHDRHYPEASSVPLRGSKPRSGMSGILANQTSSDT
jgi:aspartate kinase